jgi:predicted NUDIX family NTP pyrophosphohydrolase
VFKRPLHFTDGGEYEEWGEEHEEADYRDEDREHGDCSTGPLTETGNTKSDGYREDLRLQPLDD